MTVAGKIRLRIDAFPAGYVFTLSDFGLDPSNEVALAKLLSRMAASGELMKAAKGKYYKPRKTTFGVLKPAYEELVKDYLVKDGEVIGKSTVTVRLQYGTFLDAVPRCMIPYYDIFTGRWGTSQKTDLNRNTR